MEKLKRRILKFEGGVVGNCLKRRVAVDFAIMLQKLKKFHAWR